MLLGNVGLINLGAGVLYFGGFLGEDVGMTYSKIAVIGAGQMGAGIAQVCAQSTKDVLLVDSFQGAIEKAKVGIQKSLEKLQSKGTIKEESSVVLKRIQFASALHEVKNFSPDLVIEAVVENLATKVGLFKEIDLLVKADCVFASNTSSISITKMAAHTQRAERFVGMHFMNPVPLMPLVEMIRGLQSDSKIFDSVKALAQELGKTVVCSKDQPGFIVNRILMPMINEAVYALSEGLGTVEDIDQGMKLGTNQPMGPLTLADFIGLDTCLYIMKVLHEGLGDSKYRPCPLLAQYVDAGWLGRKAGRGFYKY